MNGNGGAAPPVKCGFDVYELFGEARVPLISDMPYAKDVSLELGYRWSDYSSIGNTNTYKVAGEWEVVDASSCALATTAPSAPRTSRNCSRH